MGGRRCRLQNSKGRRRRRGASVRAVAPLQSTSARLILPSGPIAAITLVDFASKEPRRVSRRRSVDSRGGVNRMERGRQVSAGALAAATSAASLMATAVKALLPIMMCLAAVAVTAASPSSYGRVSTGIG